MGSLMGDAELMFQMNELANALRQAMPGDLWDQQYQFGGDESLDMIEAMQVMERMQESEDLERYMRGASKPSDLERGRPRARREPARRGGGDGRQAAARDREDARGSRATSSASRDASTSRRRASAASASRRSARCISGCKSALQGEHDQPDIGRGGDITGELKHYEFGDPFHIEVKETVFEAVRRQGAGTPVKITPEDFMVERTERKVQAATALLIDLSLSMPMRGNWVAAKKVALALHALISTQFPRDRLFLIGFSDYARRDPARRAAEPRLGRGVRDEHAARAAARAPAARPAPWCEPSGADGHGRRADGAPAARTARCCFNWPPIPQTFEETLKEVARCARTASRSTRSCSTARRT